MVAGAEDAGGYTCAFSDCTAACSGFLLHGLSGETGGESGYVTRRFILSTQEDYTYGHQKYNWERPEYLKEHIRSFIEIHEDFVGKWKPTRDELVWMSEFAMNSGPLWNTLGPSLLCLRGLASDEQQGWWLQRTLKMEIVVSYAQTELGHGSNVRGLRTEAVYDPATKEFILSTPDLLAMKWWPGAMGKAPLTFFRPV